MKSAARIGKSPLHPLLILLPAGAFAIALVLDLVYMFTGMVSWWEATIPVMLVGVIGGLIAAIPGTIDLLKIAPEQKAANVGVAHMIANVLLLIVFSINIWVRTGAVAPEPGTLFGAFWLTLLGVGLLLIGGWLGGTMVYEYKMGVVDELDEILESRRDEADVRDDRIPFGGEPVG